MSPELDVSSKTSTPPPPNSGAAAAQALWSKIPRFALRSIGFIFFLWVAHEWLVPVALGAVFAVLLNPWNHKLSSKHGPLLLTVGAFVLVIVPLALVASMALTSVSEFLSTTTTTPEELQRTAVRKLLPFFRELNFGSGPARSLLSDLFEKISTYGAGMAAGIAAALPNFVIHMFLFVISLYYFLRDGDRVAAWLAKMLPFRQSETEELYTSIRETIHGALLGSIATGIVQGALVTVVFLALQIPGAFLFGIVAMILSFTPIVGTAPVTLGGMVYLILEERWVAAGIIFAAAIAIGASDNVVRPWVTSSKANLHPLLALLGIFGGISVFGPFGIFLGPVTAAMAIWTLDTYGNLRRSEAEAK